MKLTAKEIVNIYNNMQKRNIVLYGAGMRGEEAVYTLEEEGFKIVAVSDKEIGKKCVNFEAISLEKLLEIGQNEVCIMTPNMLLVEEKKVLKKNFDMVIDMQIVYWLKYYLPKDGMDYTRCFPFNHYESPYTQEREESFILNEYELKDINLNKCYQDEFLDKFSVYCTEFFKKHKEKDFRYKLENKWFNSADAALLHSMIREFCPKKIIEIGSGYSTCVMLDTNEYWFDNKIEIVCIEPYPDRLFSCIKSEDKENIKIKVSFIQEISLEMFDGLQKNDVLFIDSSHVARMGGDILREYFEILPRLQEGVIIHIHDIMYPFTYPKQWLEQGRAYNEAFILHAFLMNNSQYEILFFNDMMAKERRDQYNMMFRDNNIIGGSIWLRKKSTSKK